MGASAWEHTVPYHPDIRVAYHHARQRAFETGDYFRWWEFYDHLSKPDPFPTTIEELLLCAGLNGTHSILDYPDDVPLSPWSAEAIEAVFGTPTPSPAMIEAALPGHVFWNAFDGDYLMGYEGNRPVTITFVGASGD